MPIGNSRLQTRSKRFNMQWRTLVIAAIAVFLSLSLPHALAGSDNKLLMIIMDGFRWDYYLDEKLELPGFKDLFRQGVRAEYMIPEFPPLTFPNVYSLATGLRVENHGVVANEMYDIDTGRKFVYGFKRKGIWYTEGEPIWVTAEKQNKRAYMYNWPGCDETIKDIRPTYCKPYNPIIAPDVSSLKRALSDAYELINNDCADVIGIYIGVLDALGHSTGAFSKEVNSTLKELDNEMSTLVQEFNNRDLNQKVNVMIFSDHGMSTVPRENEIRISDFVETNDIDEILEFGAIVCIWPKEGKLNKIYNKLKAFENTKFTVYRKEEILGRWFYRDSNRIPPILIVAESEWYMSTPRWNAGLLGFKGYHGYDNLEEEMRAIFVGFGPNFKTDVVIPSIQMVDLYQVMCDVLNIEAAENDGNGDVTEMIKNGATSSLEYSSKDDNSVRRVDCIPRSEILFTSIVSLSFLLLTYPLYFPQVFFL